MKALTLTQPWATLVAAGAKRIETRSWSTSHRGPLAIHAAATCPPWTDGLVLGEWRWQRFRPGGGCLWQKNDDGSTRLPLLYPPFGAVIAACRLVDVVRIEVERLTDIGVPDPSVDLREGWKGQVWDAWRERDLGDFSVGRFAWLLADIAPLEKPVQAKGRLGLWEWSP